MVPKYLTLISIYRYICVCMNFELIVVTRCDKFKGFGDIAESLIIYPKFFILKKEEEEEGENNGAIPLARTCVA